MKTIIDAVKYYGGHNFVVGKHETHHTHIANSSISNNIYSAYIYDIHKDNVICSIKEFNNAINDMQYNFGKVTHGDFYDYINADKEILHAVSCTNIQSLTVGDK
jgi:hypothetical protein